MGLTQRRNPYHANQKNTAITARDLAKIVRLKYENQLPTESIAKLLNTTEDAVRRVLKPFETAFPTDHQLFHTFKAQEAVFLNIVRLRILELLVREDRLAKASYRDLAVAFRIITEAYRLTTNQSTANIDLRSINLSLSELKAQREELEQELRDISKALPNIAEEE